MLRLPEKGVKMIKIETKANRVVMWVLVALGLIQVFWFSYGFGYGFTTALLGH